MAHWAAYVMEVYCVAHHLGNFFVLWSLLLLSSRNGCKILWWVCLFVCLLHYLRNHMSKLDSVVLRWYCNTLFFRFCKRCHVFAQCRSSCALSIFLSGKNTARQKLLNQFLQNFTHKTDQQLLVVGCTLWAKSAICDCLATIRYGISVIIFRDVSEIRSYCCHCCCCCCRRC